MVSVFTQPDVNTREVGRTRDKRIELIECIPTSQVFTSGYVNTETILHFFYKITNERGTKTVFTYAHVKWFYGQSERAYYLNYFIKTNYLSTDKFVWDGNVTQRQCLTTVKYICIAL